MGLALNNPSRAAPTRLAPGIHEIKPLKNHAYTIRPAPHWIQNPVELPLISPRKLQCF